MNNIVDEMEFYQKMDRKSQIKTSIADSKKALTGELGGVTREYLNNYIRELEEELRQLGDN